MSERVSARLEPYLAKELSPQSDVRTPVAPRATQFNSRFEPTSWRALAGLDSIWLFDEDIRQLPPRSRAALADWVLRGGALTVLHTRELAPSLDLPLADVGAADGRHGFGRVSWLQLPEEARLGRQDVAPHLPRAHAHLEPGSTLAKDVPQVETARVAVAVVVIAFFLLAGPVNVLYIARGQRDRLLVSTPCISLGASLVLVLVILLQEGIGGTGTRYVAHLLQPEMHREVIVQEQISRTGALLSRRFTTAPDVLLQRYALQDELYASWQFVARPGGEFAGDWFRTRAVQAHLLEQVRASRSRVERVPGSAAEAPELLSSLPVTVERIYVVDRDGRTWAASDLRPGEKRALAPIADLDELQAVLRTLPRGCVLRDLLASGPRPWHFYAIAAASPASANPTLATIAWQYA